MRHARGTGVIGLGLCAGGTARNGIRGIRCVILCPCNCDFCLRNKMLVRDKTKLKTEYKGRLTWAYDSLCPCRSCFNAHDCGYWNSQGKWVVDMHCVTNRNSGCPNPLPEPTHIFMERGRVCKRCGTHRKLASKSRILPIDNLSDRV